MTITPYSLITGSSCTQVIQAASPAGAFGWMRPVEVWTCAQVLGLSTFTGIAIGAIAHCALTDSLSKLSAIHTALDSEQKCEELGFFKDAMTEVECARFFIVPLRLERSPDSIQQATRRANDFYRELKGYGPEKSKWTDRQAAEELDIGICYGAVSALLDRCKKGIFMKEAARMLETAEEEMLFRQLHCYTLRAAELKKQLLLQQISSQDPNSDGLPEQRDKLSRLETAISELEKRGIHAVNYKNHTKVTIMKEEGYASSFIELKARFFGQIKTECKVFDSLEKYNETLNQLIAKFDSNYYTVQGSISIPDHLMAFEINPKGYCLFDTFSIERKGLYFFQDKATFIKAIRTFAQRTTRNPEGSMETEPLETLKEMKLKVFIHSLL